MRLFVGLPLTEDIRSQLQLAWDGLRNQPDHCTLIDKRNWHITVAFLGEIADENFETVKMLFDKATTNPPGGAFFIHEFRTFPPKHQSYLIAHAVPENHAEWKEYIEKLRDMLSIIAPQIDRKPWIPHIAIAKIKKGGIKPVWSQPLKPVLWKPKTISIVQSKLTREGTRYTNIYDIPQNL